ncbi:hypothetical protein [Priestia megaterium]|uniref:hypothetical protein n=1 Tax=Priestia megaterium TaxID=1404 RepID=UPI00273052BE|nr:hypothetical protein [Priestia megaterium]MDP1442204.1 hypothetical protein [Priestia megaterium]MDP1471206.1 hypothetical protein [Priestia megaterium]
MNKKWLLSAVAGIVVALGIGTAFVSSYNSSEVKGNGELEELHPLEMKKFMKEDGTGFVMYSFRENTRPVYMNEVKKALKENDVDAKEIYSRDLQYDRDKNSNYYGVPQDSDTLAAYKDGELKQQIKLDDYESSQLETELSHFIETSKELYFEE